MQSPLATTRSQALRTLAAHPDPALIGALLHEVRAGSNEAVDALVAHGAAATAPVIRSLAKSRPKPFVPVLGRLGTNSTDDLLSALSHPNRQVRTLSAMALGHSDDQCVPFELLRRIDDDTLTDPIRKALIEWVRHNHYISDDLLERIEGLLTTGSAPQHLYELTMMLTRSDDPRVAPLLISVLDDPAAFRWRDHYVMMLARLDHPSVEPTLIRVLEDSRRDLGERMNAITGLARLQSNRAVPLLNDLAALPQERPILPSGALDREKRQRATKRSLHEQTAWKLKLLAQAALRHLADPTEPMKPDYKRMQPLPSRSAPTAEDDSLP
jgi:HEAT repeat protein